ncbi:MAG TPA: methyltransferase domain-containing protein [Rhizomicrobium sp.]|nr:methyltransferase domain-containing protein [Rhizomicrobium sp.]
MTEAELAIVRRAYAMQVLAGVGVVNSRVEDAFAAVKREDYLGPGPWQIFRWGMTYRPTPSADPVYLYTDDLVGIIPERRLNNGQPQYHAHLIHQAAPAPGEHVVHIGTGTGYYTAVMAHLVGPNGRVTGIEFDPGLAARTRANFADRTNVAVIEGDGAAASFDPADVIYVNAGATRPADQWLDRLRDGGRLILPLTTDKAFGDLDRTPNQMINQGAVFRIERRSEAYLAKVVSAVAIIPCEGTRDEDSEKALAKALAGGRLNEVTRLYRHENVPDEDCWLKAPGWSLAYR